MREVAESLLCAGSGAMIAVSLTRLAGFAVGYTVVVTFLGAGLVLSWIARTRR